MKLYYISRTVIAKCFVINHKNYIFLDCDWFKKLLFSTNSLTKLLSDSLLLDRGGKLLKKLWCCVGGVYYKIIWFY